LSKGGLLDQEIRLNSPNTIVIGDREAVGVSLREKAFAATWLMDRNQNPQIWLLQQHFTPFLQ
jgi:hypothetical protein